MDTTDTDMLQPNEIGEDNESFLIEQRLPVEADVEMLQVEPQYSLPTLSHSYTSSATNDGRVRCLFGIGRVTSLLF
jgi:hypothetical protein